MKANRSKKRRLFLIANKFVAIIVLLFFSTQTALANPYGAQVASGNVGINTQGNTLTVTNSPNSIINWQGFSIASNEAVRFIQQSSQSAVLNRIIGQNPSAILGALQSNGRVFLINPNGILFGQGAQINVNGLVASTLNLSNQDFLAGKYNFTDGALAGQIKNQGTITTPAGGKVYLIAPDIENSGIINSPKGDIILAAGHSVQLVDSFNPDISVVVSAPENKAVNLGQIMAQSGRIGIYGGLIQQKGLVSADSAVVGENGKIYFKATKDINLDAGSTTSAKGGGTIKILGGMDNGTVTVNGALDASAPGGGDGGFIETSAAHVKVGNDAAITTLAPYGKTGTWLIDPTDYTIGVDITGGNLSSQLNSTDVTIATSSAGAQAGNITVNDTVTWETSHTLTLKAHNDINVNDAISSYSPGGLVLRADADGNGAGTVTFGASGLVYMLPGQGAPVSLYYNTTNYSSTNDAIYNTKITADAGKRTYYMLVNSVTDLQAMNTNHSGTYALGKDIDASATSGWNAGKGFLPIGDTGAPVFSGVFDGNGYVITNLIINRLSGTNYVGLFGYNSGIIRNVGVINGSITGYNDVGGLAGWNNTNGSISNSYYAGTVNGGSTEVGGLVGCNKGSISNSYTAGTVTNSNDYVGGLVGNNYVGGTISNSYSTAAVSGNYAGGLVGCNIAAGISNSYSTGAVSGTNLGGLIALYSSGAITNSYWDTETSGRATSGGGTGKTTAEMMTQATYTGWDFANTWWMSPANTRPFLRSEYRTTINNAHQLQLMGMNATTLGASYALGSDIDMSELTRASGMWKTATGFVPIGNNSAPFTGTFDGLGHTINGLFIYRPNVNDDSNNYIGLFGDVSVTATITNVGLLNTNIAGSWYVGGLVGSNFGHISNSYSIGHVTGGTAVGGLIGTSQGVITSSYSGGTVSGGDDAGGLAGYSGYGSINNTYSIANVTGGNYVGGLVGYNVSETISNSYSTGAVSGSTNVGGLVGGNYYDTNYGPAIITNSYSTGAVSGNNGGLVGNNNGGTITNSFWDTATSGQAISAGGTGKTTTEMMTQATYTGWDFTNTWWMSNTRPFLRWEYSTTITNARQLQLMGMNLGASYTLAKNIDLGPELAAVNGKYPGMWGAAGFAPIGNGATRFTGTFDGLGHTVTGLYINRPATNEIGLFGYTNNSTIQNVGLVNVNITGQNNVGGLVGFNYGSSIINNSYSTGAVNGNTGIGGLAGVNSAGIGAGISNSYSTATVSGDQGVGGLVGENQGIISDSHSTGAVNGAGDGYSIGGLVGYNSGSISGSYSTGAVTGAGDGYSVGGLVGGNNSYGTISASYSTGAVNGNRNVGGLVGWNNGSISNSHSTGAVNGNTQVGGLVGYNDAGAIDSSWNEGTVTGPGNYVGGLVGANEGSTIDSSWNEGTVNGTGGYVGGLVGSNDTSSISNSYNTGTVNGNTNVGGLVGWNDYGSVNNSFSTGAVNGNINVGGLVGWNNGGISNSYSTGTVNGNTYVGGLVGYNYNYHGTIDSSWNEGTVTGTGDYVGGLAGYNDATSIISNTHNSGAVAGASYVGGLIGYNEGAISNSSSSSTVTGVTIVGGLVGQQAAAGGGSSTIANSSSSGTVTGTSEVGGLVGRAHATGGGTVTITDSYSNADVTGNFRIGGLVGHTNGMISNSYNTGTVTGSGDYIGGLVGFNLGGSIDSSHSNGNVSGTGNYVGGLVGHNGIEVVNIGDGEVENHYGSITNSYATGTVSGGENNVGGLAGYNQGIIDSSYNTGAVSGDWFVGGLAGFNDTDASISNSYNTGTVTGTGDFVGGLVGANYISGSISSSYSTGAVTGTNEVGGLAGFNQGSIDSSYNTGTVSGVEQVGGLAGGNSDTGSIERSYSTGEVSGTGGDYVGGLVGLNAGSISNSYSTGAVDGSSNYVGGLVGASIGSITNSYSAGMVNSGVSRFSVGGLAGLSSGTVTNSFWDTETSGQEASSGGTGLTTVQMMQQASYSGWDFAGTWSITAGTSYPYLQWQSAPSIDTWLWTADYNWATITNWSLGRAPLAGDLVVINGATAGSYTITVPGAYAAFAKSIISNENLTIAGGSLFLTAGANSSLFGSGTTLSLTGGGTLAIGSSAALTAYNLNLISGDILGPGSLIVSNSFSQSAGGTIGATTPLANLNITQAAGNLVIADLLKASGNISLRAYANITQTGSIAAAGLELLGTGGTYSLNNAANTVTTLAGNTGSVSFTNSSGLSIGTVNATSGLTTTGNTQIVSGADLTLNGIIDAGSGTVTLNSGGAIINGMGSSTSIMANALTANAVNGIGSGNPLMTAVHNLSAVNTTSGNIEIDNTGVLAVADLSNGGTGNVILQNIGAITTGASTVTSAGGNVSITAHSPLTIGAGGVSADGNIALEAAPSGGSDGLTINGSIASSNGNLILTAGSSIVLGPGAALSAPHGTISQAQQLNGTPAPAADSTVTGNTNATNNTSVAFESAMETIATVTTISEPDKKEDEEQKKKKEGGEKGTDEKKLDNKDKKYCN